MERCIHDLPAGQCAVCSQVPGRVTQPPRHARHSIRKRPHVPAWHPDAQKRVKIPLVANQKEATS